MNNFAIAIHGGAGKILRNLMTVDQQQAVKESLQKAILAGYEILSKGGSALDAVQVAVITMEDDPLFNAGRGSVLNCDGKVEMDASIMNGHNLQAGAVSAVSNVRNPILLSRLVLEQTNHVYLVGAGAMQFAKSVNLQFENDDYFIVETSKQQLANIKSKEKSNQNNTSTTTIQEDKQQQESVQSKFGTVGAVALDMFGNLAAATSTGGMMNKKFGRVGDSAVIGAGTYANNRTCAVSGTGHGEFFIRGVVAYDVSCLMEYKGLALKEACDFVIHQKMVQIGGSGGLIAIDAKGNIEMPFNTEGMYRGFKKSDGEMMIELFKD